jgi:conjugative transfer signal peptidase TraF
MRPASVAYLCWSIALAIWLAVKIADAAGIRINHTPSLPMGIWRIEPLQGPLQRGQIVSFCPPDTAVMRKARDRGYVSRGRCPGGYEPMLKTLIAIAGDQVTVAEHGVTVNGKLAANSGRMALDAGGNASPAIPGGAYNTEPGQVWMLSAHHTRSFDSRYFGPVPMENILGLAVRGAWPRNAPLAGSG